MKFYCDTCGELMNKEDGAVSWLINKDENGEFWIGEMIICHRSYKCDTLARKGHDCWMPLEDMLRPDWCVTIFGSTHCDLYENDSARTTLRRLLVKGYEEARHKHPKWDMCEIHGFKPGTSPEDYERGPFKKFGDR